MLFYHLQLQWFLVQMWYIACIFGIGPSSMNFFRKNKKTLSRVMTLDKNKITYSLDTSNICEVSKTLYRGLWPSIKIKYFIQALFRPSKHLFRRCFYQRLSTVILIVEITFFEVFNTYFEGFDPRKKSFFFCSVFPFHAWILNEPFVLNFQK